MRRVLAFVFLLTACSPDIPQDGAILAIGDSVMAWNGDAGIPEATASALGRPVVDRSQSLARLTAENGLAGSLGFDITRQFVPGPWSWVIFTGGGNDIRDACATPAVDALRDELIDANLNGEIPALIRRIRATGAGVAFVGYYDGAAASPTGFTPCQPEFDIINARMTRYAATRPGVVFLDAAVAIDPDDAGNYDPDLIHPSPRGSVQIGQALAAAIRAAEGD